MYQFSVFANVAARYRMWLCRSFNTSYIYGFVSSLDASYAFGSTVQIYSHRILRSHKGGIQFLTSSIPQVIKKCLISFLFVKLSKSSSLLVIYEYVSARLVNSIKVFFNRYKECNSPAVIIRNKHALYELCAIIISPIVAVESYLQTLLVVDEYSRAWYTL